MIRRDFFSILTAFFGIAVSSKITELQEIAISPTIDTKDLFLNPCVFAYKNRPPNAIENKYGKNAAIGLQELRKKYFQSGKLLSQSKVARKKNLSEKVQLYIVFTFDTSVSKKQYLLERSRILTADHSSMLMNKA
ncbi:MAG: hypothetical protein WA160_05590 [Pseudobdellovibrio sp.]